MPRQKQKEKEAFAFTMGYGTQGRKKAEKQYNTRKKVQEQQ